MSDIGIKNFIEKMGESEELLRAGFYALERRKKPSALFDAVLEGGFYANGTFLPPQTADEGQSFSIPAHPGLNYLRAIAREVSVSEDANVIGKLTALIKRVTAINPGGRWEQLNNHYTWMIFAEIMGLLPVSHYDDTLVFDVKTWVSSKFDSGLVIKEITETIIPKLFEANGAKAIGWAVEILEYVTDFTVVEGKRSDRNEIKGVVDEYWLKGFFKKHSGHYGQYSGLSSTEVLATRISQAHEDGKLPPSSWYRSAIEEHEQNVRDNDFASTLIAACRDVSSSWVKAEPVEATKSIGVLLDSEVGALRRIALFLATEHFALLKSSIFKKLKTFFDDAEYHHELYRLLDARFAEFTADEQTFIADLVRDLDVPAGSDERTRRLLARDKLVWLEAMHGKGSLAADKLRAEIRGQWPEVALSDHPDFLTYFESWSGPGESSFTSSELVGLAKAGKLVSTFNEMTFDPNVWRGPTLAALTATLEQSVRDNPDTFVSIINEFLNAKPAYQYAVVAGFAELRSRAEFPRDHELWKSYWPRLIAYAKALLNKDDIWQKPEGDAQPLEPTNAWIPSRVLDLFKSGLNDDKNPINWECLDDTLALIDLILRRSAVIDEYSGESANHALNTTKGRAFEVFIAYALRGARINKDRAEAREAEWEKVKGIFERELALCTDANLDVSSLLGTYLPHLSFLNHEWLVAHITKIFPYERYKRSFRAAVGGLAYANANNLRIFSLLLDNGVLEAAVKSSDLDEHAEEKVYQRLGLGVLWGTINLTSPPLRVALESEKVSALGDMADFIGRLFSESVGDAEKSHVRNLWLGLDTWVGNNARRSGLLRRLGGLLAYVDVITPDLLLPIKRAIANTDTFALERVARELTRLYASSPDQAVALFGEVVANKALAYDYQDRLKTFIRNLAPAHLEFATKFAVDLRRISGMAELLEELKRRPI